MLRILHVLLGLKSCTALVATTPCITSASPLIAWAKSHGARIVDAIEIKSGPFGQGLFAAADIASGTEMVMLPGALQLGVNQLARGGNTDLQSLCQGLPGKGAASVPCGISLCAEVALGPASLFAPYISELPALLSGALAPSATGYGSSSSSNHDDAVDLACWPATGCKVRDRRRVVRELHTACAPASLSLSDLCWASAIAESRAFRTSNVPPLSATEANNVGSRAAADQTRLLPVIDLANHAGALSNAAVGNIRRTAHRMEGSAPPEATSLISTREIKSGEEITLHYGHGRPIDNERLLLEYGFLLRPHADDWLNLPLHTLVASAAVAMPSAQAERITAGIEVMSADEVLDLMALKEAMLTMSDGSVDAGLFKYGANGVPSLQALALALALTCRDASELASLRGEDRLSISLEDLVARCAESASHFNRALAVLRLTAAKALKETPPVCYDISNDRSSFDDSARAFYETRREILSLAALHGTPDHPNPASHLPGE